MVKQISVVLCVGMFVWVGHAYADSHENSHSSDASEEIEDVEHIETIEAVEAVEAVEVVPAEILPMADAGGVSEESSTSLSLVTLLGRLHPAFVHFPLGLLVALLLFELGTMKQENGIVGWFLWGGALLSFFPAGISGFLRAQEILSSGGLVDVTPHRNWMIAAFVVGCVAFVCKLLQKKWSSQSLRFAVIGIILLSLGFAFLGAHLGGKLVYGHDFLPF